jgi:hypothetical protein
MIPTTFRQDMSNGLFRLLTDFRTAAPDRLPGGIFRKRPLGMNDTILAFVGPYPEQIVHDSGLRTRSMVPTVVFVNTFGFDDDVAEDALNATVDEFIDFVTARPYAVSSNFPISPSQVEDVELDVGGGLTKPAAVITFSNGRPGTGGVSIQEGRS